MRQGRQRSSTSNDCVLDGCLKVCSISKERQIAKQFDHLATEVS